MNLSQLRQLSRERLVDSIIPYRWSDTQIDAWINEANSQAFRRLRYKVNSALSVAMVSGTSAYNIPADVIFVQRAKIVSEDLPLCFESYKTLDERVAGWESHTGTPSHILMDISPTQFTLYPIPDANGTIKLTGIMQATIITDTLDLPERFHYALIDWVAFRAFAIHQTEDGNLDVKYVTMSQEALKAFTLEFGEESTAKNEIYNAKNRPFDGFDGNY